MPEQHIASVFDRDLEAVQARIMKMGGLVEAAIMEAARSLETRDEELANKVRRGDAAIDALEDMINQDTARLIALRAPAAGDLRIVLTVMKISANLERIGDYAKNIAKRTGVLSQQPPVNDSAASLRRMAREVELMLKDALDSYIQRDTELARDVIDRDREVDQKRVEVAFQPADVTAADEDDFRANPGLVKGYIGPWSTTGAVLGEEAATGIRYLLDKRVVDGSSWITGANEPGKHVFGLVAGRDFAGDGWVEAADVRPGDPAPDGSGPVTLERGMEVGHVFQLGRKYAEALGLKVLDQNGKLVTVTMGSYGIGVTRNLAAIVERSHDEQGIIWPREIAPFDVHVVATGKDVRAFEVAESVIAGLEARGLEVLFDDRPKVSPGVKFGDAEIIGVPQIVIVGRDAHEGLVDVWDRATGERQQVALDALEEALGR